MSLSLTYEDLLNIQTGLNKIITLSEKEDSNIEFKIKWRVSRIIKKLNPELQDFSEQRQALLKKLGTEIFTVNKDKVDSDGKPISESTGQFNLGSNAEEYNKLIKEMLKESVQLEGNIFKLKLSEIKNIKGLSISDYVSLDAILDEDIDIDDVDIYMDTKSVDEVPETVETK